jgi:hypothetical protein
MVIGQLAKAGFIAEQETSREGLRPERTVYALTDAGAASCGTGSANWSSSRSTNTAFVAALSLIGALPPSQVLELLRRRLGHLAQQEAEACGLVDTSLANGVPGLFLIEEEYRLALLEAESAFVDQLIQRITDPATDWIGLWAEFHGEKTPATHEE